VAIDERIIERGWEIQDRYQLSFWDAMIVAAAKAASCQYLLTEDLQANQDLNGIRVVNPFEVEPAAILGT
jgi:predicted nucleic acid-binding protein